MVSSVGYGDAIVLRTPKSVIMIDAGDAVHIGRIMTKLQLEGIVSIDVLILTHSHENHAGGLIKVTEALPIRQLWLSEATSREISALSDPAVRSRIGFIRNDLKTGMELYPAPNILVKVLSPLDLTGDLNADSLVLLVQYGQTDLLFCADITPAIQARLLDENQLKKSPQWVLLPHHGGELDPRFAAFVKKSIKVISTGPSLFGTTPAASTLAIFPKQLYRTDLLGDLSFESDGRRIRRVTNLSNIEGSNEQISALHD